MPECIKLVLGLILHTGSKLYPLHTGPYPLFMHLFLKTLSGMADSIESTLFAYAILPETFVYKNLGHLL